MDQNYLQQLIDEINARNGGMILNVDNRPSAVVLSIEKYNELIQKSEIRNPKSEMEEQTQTSQALFRPKTVLVTGGAGYIGAHLSRHLINAGHKVVILDDLSAGKRENLAQEAKFIEGDCGDVNLLRDIFASEKIDAVMHLAASIEVEESVKEPLKYLENNTFNTARLLMAMDEAGVKQIIFSSTAAVYGEQDQQPILESAALRPNNPYGYSKYLAEEIIRYYCITRGFKAVIYRYFNACGSDFDGKIQPTHDSHLLAKLLEVAAGRQDELVVNGTDYPTHDGTCIRDYVHVLDIASAHISALNQMNQINGFNVYNIGTGRGVSVLEMVNSAAENLNRMIPMRLGVRRPGDAPESVADCMKIKSEFNFEAKFSDLETIVKTSHRQIQNHQT